MRYLLLLLLGFISFYESKAQVLGCTDPYALNYSPTANSNDGSCIYAPINVSVDTSLLLPGSLIESSGLMWWNNQLYSQNDSNDSLLYIINPATASITDSIRLSHVLNIDWEEIQQDSAYIFVGDIGNNASGNRQDLHFLRIWKDSLFSNHLRIDTLYFRYATQNNFTAAGPNNTDFDCEAFLVIKDSIYLFTKEWKSEKCHIYRIYKYADSAIAILIDSLDVKGLITGASYLPNPNRIVLCGYSSLLQPFLFLDYQFIGNNFSMGCKRKVGLNLPFHQVEAITACDSTCFYLSNEYFTRSIITTPQQLHRLNLDSLLKSALYPLSVNNAITNDKNCFIYPNLIDTRFVGELNIQSVANEESIENAVLINQNGAFVHHWKLSGPKINWNLSLAEGTYMLLIYGDRNHLISSQKLVIKN